MNGKTRDWNRMLFKVLLLSPAVGFLLFYMYYPIEETFRLSFTNSNTARLANGMGA